MERHIEPVVFATGPATRANLLGDAAALLRIAFWIACLTPIWFSLYDHPLYHRSEGRYAEVSLNMASGAGWLVPKTIDRAHPGGLAPHLTKPPLTYWLEAASIRLLGANELAVRLPCAIAGSLTLAAVYIYCRRTAGTVTALLAAGTLAILPLHVALSRSTLTDGLLGLFWFGTLAAGALAVREPARRRWPALLWACVALGLLTKGPVAWLPVAVLIAWLAPSRRWRDLRALRFALGLPLSLAPLLAWVAMILAFEPGAATVWLHQMADRVRGAGDLHPEPWWFFIPVFVAGLVPATLMLELPGLNFPLARAREMLRRGEEAALWAIAIALPLVVFSLVRGKLPSYLLPVAAPVAILTGRMLRRQADPNHRAASGERPPRIAGVLAVGLVGALLLVTALWLLPVRWLGHGSPGGFAGVLAALRAALPWAPLALVPAAAAAALLASLWNRSLEWRLPGLAAVWIGLLIAWAGGVEIEDHLTQPGSDAQLLAAIERKTALHEPSLALFGYGDDSLSFYAHRPVPRLDRDALAAAAAAHPRDLVVIADPDDWSKMRGNHPEIASRFAVTMEWRGSPVAPSRLVLRPVESQ